MVVQGQFETLSMAIYGQVISDIPPVPSTYESTPRPLIESTPLSESIDPANSSDPTLLAKQLLELVPNSPPLSLVIRLVLCMKPDNDDWDHPEFPYLHADLETNEPDMTLTVALDIIGRPIHEGTSNEALAHFVASVLKTIGTKVTCFYSFSS
jgi:hypothetical protein